MKGLRIAIVAFAPVIIALVLVTSHSNHAATNQLISPAAGRPKRCAEPDTGRHYVGVALYRPQQITLPQFINLTGVHPSIIEYYVDFGTSLDLARASQIYQNSAFPIVQVDAYHASLQSIAHGRYDAYLRSQARAVAGFHCPIAMSFGHEMDGPWYKWGFRHTPPAAFRAAWRHICHVFASAGARNVIWTWTISRESPYTSPLPEWWPGKRYVSWVGVDGYYRKPGVTFAWLFRKTLRDVQHLTHDPILITETSVTRMGPQARQIKNLFRAARRSDLFGVIWFNINAMQQWTLAGRPPAVLSEFRKASSYFMHLCTLSPATMM